MLRRVPWLVLFFLSMLVGCSSGGSGSGELASGGSTGNPGLTLDTGTIRLRLVLERSVPRGVTQIRLTGFDPRGEVRYGPVAKPKSATLDFTSVPILVRRVQLEFLDARGVIGVATIDVELLAGQITEISDPDFSDIDAVFDSLELSPPTGTIARGTSLQFSAVGRFQNGSVLDLSRSVTWSSSGPGLTVDDIGLAQGVAKGSYLVTARFGDKVAQATVRVTDAIVNSLRVNPSNATIPVGTSQDFLVTAVFSDGSEQDVTSQTEFSLSDSGLTEVSGAAGRVVGRAPGRSRLQASFQGHTASAELEVTPATLRSLHLRPVAQTLAKGLSTSFEVFGVYSDGSEVDVSDDVTWSVEHPAIAGVDQQGLVFALAEGQTRVIAEHGEISSTAMLNVTAAVPTALAVSPGPPISMANGTRQPLTVTATFSDSTQAEVTQSATYSSSIPTVASVTTLGNRGVLTAAGSGSTEITVTLQDQRQTFTVTVTPAAAISVRLSLVAARAVDRVITGYKFSLVTGEGDQEQTVAGPRAFEKGGGSSQEVLWPELPPGSYTFVMELVGPEEVSRGIFQTPVTLVDGQTLILEDPDWEDRTLPVPPLGNTSSPPADARHVATSGLVDSLAIDAKRGLVYGANRTLGRVEIYDIASRSLLAPVAVGVEPWGIDLTPDGDTLAVCLPGEYRIALLDLKLSPPTVSYVNFPTPHELVNQPRRLGFAANGKALITCGRYTWGNVWEMNLTDRALKQRSDYPGGLTSVTTFVAHNRSHEMLVLAQGGSSRAEYVRYFSATDSFGSSKGRGSYHSRAAVSDDGDRVTAGNLTFDREDRVLGIYPNGLGAQAYLPGGQRAVGTYKFERKLDIIDMERLQPIETLSLPAEVGEGLVVTDDGRRAFGGTASGILDIDLGANRPPVPESVGELLVPSGASVGTTVQAYDPEADPVTSVAHFLPNGSFFQAIEALLSLDPTGDAGSSSAVVRFSDGQNERDLTVPLRYTEGNLRFVPFPGALNEMTYDPARRILYASNLAKNRVERFSMPGFRRLAPLQTDGRPNGLDLLGSTLAVACNHSEFVNVFDVAEAEPAPKRRVYMERVDQYDWTSPNDVALTPSGLLLVTNAGGSLRRAQPGSTVGIPDSGFFEQYGSPVYVTSTADHKKLLFVEGGGTSSTIYATLYNAAEGSTVRLTNVSSSVSGIELSPQASAFATLPGPSVYRISGALQSASSSRYRAFTFLDESFGYAHKETAQLVKLDLTTMAVQETLALPAVASGPLLAVKDEGWLFVSCDGGLALIELTP